MKATTAQIEAVAQADAHLTNAGLPSYAELATAIRRIATSSQMDHYRIAIARQLQERMPQLCPPEYTERYDAEGQGGNMTIRVQAGVDLDGRFCCWDEDNNELIFINGWQWTFDPLVKYVVQNDAGLYYGKPDGGRKWVASMANAEPMSLDSAKHMATVERGFTRLWTEK